MLYSLNYLTPSSSTTSTMQKHTHICKTCSPFTTHMHARLFSYQLSFEDPLSDTLINKGFPPFCPHEAQTHPRCISRFEFALLVLAPS